MGWTCRRPGCHREAAASIGYDPVACQVWLDPLGATRSGQHLCEDHAERLHAPRGWVVVDRRGRQSSIVARPLPPGGGVAPAVPRATRAPRRWGQLQEPRLEFTAVSVEARGRPAAPTTEGGAEHRPPEAALPPESGVAAEVGVDEHGAPSPPDALGELMAPTSPLLSRAFESAAPRRSALLPDPSADDTAGG